MDAMSWVMKVQFNIELSLTTLTLPHYKQENQSLMHVPSTLQNQWLETYYMYFIVDVIPTMISEMQIILMSNSLSITK